MRQDPLPALFCPALGLWSRPRMDSTTTLGSLACTLCRWSDLLQYHAGCRTTHGMRYDNRLAGLCCWSDLLQYHAGCRRTHHPRCGNGLAGCEARAFPRRAVCAVNSSAVTWLPAQHVKAPSYRAMDVQSGKLHVWKVCAEQLFDTADYQNYKNAPTI